MKECNTFITLLLYRIHCLAGASRRPAGSFSHSANNAYLLRPAQSFCRLIASASLAASCALLSRKAFWDSTLSGPRYSLILPII